LQKLKGVVGELLVQVLLEADLVQDVVEGLEARFLFGKLVLVASAEERFEIAEDCSWQLLVSDSTPR